MAFFVLSGYFITRSAVSKLGDMSCAIYLAHYPFIVAVAGIFIELRKTPNNLHGYLIFAAFGIATLLYCTGIYYLAERHDRSVRRWALRWARSFDRPAVAGAKAA
jgi:peptidoglycan/LPS O-acetylase OafA/YrhL